MASANDIRTSADVKQQRSDILNKLQKYYLESLQTEKGSDFDKSLLEYFNVLRDWYCPPKKPRGQQLEPRDYGYHCKGTC